jgi:hypothetical protein
MSQFLLMVGMEEIMGLFQGIPKCFEYEGPYLTKKKKNHESPPSQILTLRSRFRFMCNVLHPKIIRLHQNIYFVSISKELSLAYTTLTDLFFNPDILCLLSGTN